MWSWARAHNPACTHATRAITAATVRIDSLPNGAEWQILEPVPWAQPKLDLLRRSIPRHADVFQVNVAHVNSLSCAWPRQVFYDETTRLLGAGSVRRWWGDSRRDRLCRR